MAIARNPSFVIDCPDAEVLAGFYGALLGWPVQGDAEWAEIRDPETGQCISFQQVDAFQAPDWPGQAHPQQMHIDVVVDDLLAAEQPTLDLGATKLEHQPSERGTFVVYTDVAGHPFCLCTS